MIMSKKLQIPDKKELEEKYSNYGATISSLAIEYNTTNPTVRKWLIFYGIKRKTQKDASTEANRRNMNQVQPSKDVLIDDLDSMSIDQIEGKYKVGQSTIYEWIKSYNIDHGSLSKRTKLGKDRYRKSLCDHSKFLQDYEKYKNIKTVADMNNVSYSFARSLLKEYDVKVIRGKISNLHKQLIDFCDGNNLRYEINDRKIIYPLELDLVIENKVAIEICGLLWHSETFGKKSKDYHANKLNLCNDKNIRLITMFYHYDIDIIKSMILNALGKSNRIYARTTTIKKIGYKECSSFEKDNHIMGTRPASCYYGLYYKDELVMTFSLGKSRFNSKYEYEIIRVTSKKYTSIIGGLSRLLKYAIKDTGCKSIITYVDLTYGTGNGYRNIMKYIRTTPPNYWYFNLKKNDVYSRVAFQKHKLKDKLDNFDDSLTEYQNMLNNGWDRYWDCGNKVFELIV